MTDQAALSHLMMLVTPVTPGMSISEVADYLLTPACQNLLSLPVVDDSNGRPLGLVSRYALQNIFMLRFGRDLRGARPVAEVTNFQALVIDINTPLEQAARLVTSRLQYPITEDFILVDDQGRYCGIATVLDMLKAMETHIAQRNASLQQALCELRESQAQLVQSEKMASLGQMVAGIAHELNTPLGYVRNNVELLRELQLPLLHDSCQLDSLLHCLTDASADEAQQASALGSVLEQHVPGKAVQLDEDLEQLHADTLYGLNQISELVNSLKDFARLDRAASQEVDLNECVHSSLRIAHHQLKERIQVTTRLETLPRLPCNPSQINQVLINLLTNAAQAIEGRGRILIRSWSSGEHAFLSVQDSGKGMPPEIQARIFDPFFTTKPVGQGTGLGLSICFKIIQNHGGDIRVTSEPGRGTRFLIRLPLSLATLQETA